MNKEINSMDLLGLLEPLGLLELLDMNKEINRPICTTAGCDKMCKISMTGNGKKYFHKLCNRCTEVKTAKSQGLTLKEYKRLCNEKVAAKRGISLNEYFRQSKIKRQGKKSFCENKDGRLGYVCTAKIAHDIMLEVDHVDGNPSNNSDENIQTLCANCHRYKTFMHKDHKTPGRTALGLR